MEKDNAEKANTELDNSVTSEEQGSLAENKENKDQEGTNDAPENPEVDNKKSEATAETEPTTEGVTEEQAPEVAEEQTAAGMVAAQATEDAEAPSVEEPAAEATPEPAAEATEPAETVEEAPAPAETPAQEPQEETSEAAPVAAPEVEAGTPATEATNDKPEAKDEAKADASGAGEEEPAKEQEPEEGDEWQDVDFSTFSREELVEVIKKLGKYEDPFKADKILAVIAPLFNKLRAEDREAALKKFIEEGGTEDNFEYKTDELSLRFDANYKLIKDKKSKKFKEQDHERVKNLALAEQVLEELRAFVDSEESTSSFNQFKAIQQKWKAIGDVPAQHSKTLWANYNALVHRFYDQRSIYFELKELDRRKNYEAKLILCEKAEALENEPNLRVAIKTLNDLHHEYKHLGPVPQGLQEELWQRFKAASDKVYEKRKEYVTELKATLHENLIKKQELVDKIKEFAEFTSDRIKDWNSKTKELIALQKSWDSIGGLPKDKAKQINKEFWSSFKKFFSNKHQFFKKMDADRDENLVKKQALLEKAIAMKDSEDWQKTTEEYKKLQSEWREIGPVPEKMRNKIYHEFKAACDYFFDRRRDGKKQSQDSYKENLARKRELIDKINALVGDADNKLDEFNTLRKQFAEIGYVPRKNIASIKQGFQEAVEGFLAAVTVLNEKEKTEISLEAEFTDLAGSEHSERELYQKEQAVRRHINKLEDDIALWRNNLEFFAHSKSTDKLRKDVNEKIDTATAQLESLKRQLKMLRSL